MPTTYAIPNGRTVMDIAIFTGDGTSPRSFTNAAGFKPDLIWQKSRSNAYFNILFDSVRGFGDTKALYSNSLVAEGTYMFGYVSSANSNGYSVTAGTSGNQYSNESGTPYVGWQWQAGQGVTSSNTAGSITSTVSVNATAGFSIVSYTGTGANATVGHGLGVAPAFIIGKKRSSTGNWQCWHSAFSGTQYISLNLTTGVNTNSTVFNGSPTSTIFNIGTDTDLNASGATNVAYCWAPVAGFSQFGSYTGNGSSDGAFIYTGIRPKFVLIKRTDSTGNWTIHDTSRNTYNVADLALYPNGSYAEDSGVSGRPIDILSNGFKCRTTDVDINANGGNYIYACFAENPLKYANAR